MRNNVPGSNHNRSLRRKVSLVPCAFPIMVSHAHAKNPWPEQLRPWWLRPESASARDSRFGFFSSWEGCGSGGGKEFSSDRTGAGSCIAAARRSIRIWVCFAGEKPTHNAFWSLNRKETAEAEVFVVARPRRADGVRRKSRWTPDVGWRVWLALNAAAFIATGPRPSTGAGSFHRGSPPVPPRASAHRSACLRP